MSVTVYAPATIANLSVGFDLLGAALSPLDNSCLGDRLSAAKADDGIQVAISGPWQHKLPADPAQNIVYQCAQHFLAQLPQAARVGLKLDLEKNLPVGSGLGSSASSVVAAFFALNELFERPFGKEQMLLMMGELEGRVSGSIHFDNVVPCYLGGLQLLLQAPGKFCDAVPVFQNWLWVIAYPGTSLSTAKMRALLPAEYSRADVIKYGRFLSGFIHASYRNDPELAAAMLNDVVAEPYRSPHIPGYNAAKQAMTGLGALASGISGSGPTMFTVTDNLETAQKAAQWLINNYVTDPCGFVRICRIDSVGVRRI